MKAAFFLLSLLFVTALNAQPTLNASNLNPVPGDKFYYHYCNTMGVTKGASGAGVTWNQSVLTTILAAPMKYVACTTTAYCDSFPGANLAVQFDTTTPFYNYFVADAGKFVILGAGIGTATTYYSNAQSLVSYPATYGSAQADSYAFVIPSYPKYAWGLDSFYADAYGTLILPAVPIPTCCGCI